MIIVPNRTECTAEELAEAIREQVITRYADPMKDIPNSNIQGIATLFSEERQEILFHFATYEGQEVKIGFGIQAFKNEPINSFFIFNDTLKQGIEAFNKMKQEKEAITLQ